MNTLRRFCLAVLPVAALAGCTMASPPAGLDMRLTQTSASAMYIVSVRPLVAAPKMNTIHAWEVTVTDSAGLPVNDARITFTGGMAQHGHGYPTQPRVTGVVGDGRYRLDGVKFSMSGWWTMKLALASARGADHVVFNTIVSPGGAPLLAGVP